MGSQNKDTEKCGKCGCIRRRHNVSCNECRNCDSFLPSGDFASFL